MLGVLPKSLEVNGKNYAIHSDFRVVLRIFQAFNDHELDEQLKAYVCLKKLYVAPESITQGDLQEALNKAFWFVGGGDSCRSKPEKVKTFDWEHDESIVFPAISKVAGFEVRECRYMHWWTFLGYFGEISEGLFSTVMHIRQKRSKGRKLDKWEAEFYNKNKSLININSKDEEDAIRETEEFLKTIT